MAFRTNPTSSQYFASPLSTVVAGNNSLYQSGQSAIAAGSSEAPSTHTAGGLAVLGSRAAATDAMIRGRPLSPPPSVAGTGSSSTAVSASVVATGVNSEIERRMAELVRTSPALAALDAMGRRTQSASGRVDSLGAELVGLAAECAELRARVAAAEQKRDASRTQMQHVLAAARHELQQLRELTGATV